MHPSESQADTDGNAWIIGKSGYAPEAGWPSFVNLGTAINDEENGTFYVFFVYGFVSCLQDMLLGHFVCIPIHFYSPITIATQFYLLGEKATA